MPSFDSLPNEVKCLIVGFFIDIFMETMLDATAESYRRNYYTTSDATRPHEAYLARQNIASLALASKTLMAETRFQLLVRSDEVDRNIDLLLSEPWSTQQIGQMANKIWTQSRKSSSLSSAAAFLSCLEYEMSGNQCACAAQFKNGTPLDWTRGTNYSGDNRRKHRFVLTEWHGITIARDRHRLPISSPQSLIPTNDTHQHSWEEIRLFEYSIRRRRADKRTRTPSQSMLPTNKRAKQ